MADLGTFLKDWAKPRYILVAFAALILIPALASVVLHWAAVPISTTEDPFGLATTLAAIMGGIFVVGGLVVILGSIATANTIDEKLKAAKAELETTIRQQRFREIDLYFKAREIITATDLTTGMAELDVFLADNSDVPHARISLAERLFETVGAEFLRTHYMQYAPDPTLHLADAVSWAHKARDLEEDGHAKAKAIALDAMLTAFQADNFGMLSRLRSVRKGMAIAKSQRSLLIEPRNLAILCSACTTELQLRELGGILDITLPMPIEGTDIIRPDQSSQWWVQLKERATWHPNRQGFPRVMNVMVPADEVRLNQISLRPRTTALQHADLIPPGMHKRIGITCEELLGFIDQNYYLIGPFK